jgi:hypothetical protein
MNDNHTPLLTKVLVCAFASFALAAALLRFGNRFLSPWIPVFAFPWTAAIIVATGIVYPFIWNRKERSRVRELSTLNFIEAVMRLSVAMDVSMFGWQKIFHMQFNLPLAMLDEPFSSFSGEWLTWAYFGRSYEFIVFVGVSQIIGSAMLLFNRTKLLGTIVLFPILINIIAIDFFYSLPVGVLFHACIMVSCVVIVMLRDYNRLVNFFLQHDLSLQAMRIKPVVKYALRLSIIYIPLLTIFLNGSPDKHPELRGKYEVTQLTINKVPIALTGDSVLTNVYFDLGNECVLEFGSFKKRLFGTYSLEKENRMNVNWHYPPGNPEFMNASISFDHDHTVLKGVMRDTIEVHMKKLPHRHHL